VKKILIGSLLIAIALLATLTVGTPSVNAQRPTPPNQRAIGLVYDGLEPDATHPGLYRVKTPGSVSGQAHSTHGPDPAPNGVNLTLTAAPAITYTTSSGAIGSTVCDGDGTSGNRVQVIYARAADVADRYDQYVASIQLWSGYSDSDFYNSGMQTGEGRHLRFVHDTNCNPIVAHVVLSPMGDDDFGSTEWELLSMGFNRTDRMYMIYMDAHVYCGIGDASSDDRLSPSNSNNFGPKFGRTDAGCWGSQGAISSHELIHNMGGVQLSAPHTDGSFHCTDGMDNMCDHSGLPINYSICTDLSEDRLFDCNHDDYYNTNPAANSYIATHWNTAFSSFLIAPLSAHVSTLATGNVKPRTGFTASSVFRNGETLDVQVRLVDQRATPLTNASVVFGLYAPGGLKQATFSATTDATGTAIVSVIVPKTAKTGQVWAITADNVIKTNYYFNTAPAAKVNFTVK